MLERQRGLTNQIKIWAGFAQAAGLIKNQARYIRQLTRSIKDIENASIPPESAKMIPLFVDPRIPLASLLNITGIQCYADTDLVTDWRYARLTRPASPYITYAFVDRDLTGKSTVEIRKTLDQFEDRYGGTAREGIALYLRNSGILNECFIPLVDSEVGTDAALDLTLVGIEDDRKQALSPRRIDSARLNSAPLICTSPIPLLPIAS